jgi:urea transport system substrate-binding protein
MNGSISLSESDILRAEQLAIDEINDAGGILGNVLTYTLYDGHSNPREYERIGDRISADSSISAVFTSATGTCKDSLLNHFQTERSDIWFTSPTEGEVCDERQYNIGGIPNQLIDPIVPFILSNLPQKFVIMFDSSNQGGTLRNIGEQIANRTGIREWSTLSVPFESEFNSTSRRSIIESRLSIIRDSSSLGCTILNFLSGSVNRELFETLRSLSMNSTQFPVLNYFLSEADGLSRHVLRGHYILTGLTSRIFEQKFRQRYDRSAIVSFRMEAAYLGILSWAEAMNQAGSFNRTRISRIISDKELSIPNQASGVARNHYAMIRSGLFQFSNGTMQAVSVTSTIVYPIPYSSWLPSSNSRFCQFTNNSDIRRRSFVVLYHPERPHLLWSLNQMLNLHYRSLLQFNVSLSPIVVPLSWNRRSISVELMSSEIVFPTHLNRSNWNDIFPLLEARNMFVSSSSFDLPCARNIIRTFPHFIRTLQGANSWIGSQGYRHILILDDGSSNPYSQNSSGILGQTNMTTVSVSGNNTEERRIVYNNIVDTWRQAGSQRTLIVDSMVDYDDVLYDRIPSNSSIQTLRITKVQSNVGVRSDYFASDFFPWISEDVNNQFTIPQWIPDYVRYDIVHGTIGMQIWIDVLRGTEGSDITPSMIRRALYNTNFHTKVGEVAIDFSNNIMTPIRISKVESSALLPVFQSSLTMNTSIQIGNSCYFGPVTKPITNSSNLRFATGVAAGSVLLIVLFSCHWLIRNRKNPKIKRNGFILLLMLVLGSGLGLVSVFFMLGKRPSIAICVAGLWTEYFGIFCISGSLIHICSALLKASRTRSIMTIRIVRTSKWKVFLPFNFLVMILLIKFIMEPSSLIQFTNRDDYFNPELFVQCRRSVFDEIIADIWWCTIVAALVLALQISVLPHFQSEGRYFAVIGLAWFLSRLLSQLLTSYLTFDDEVFFAIRSWFMILACTITLIGVMLPRWNLQNTNTEEKDKQMSVHSTSSHGHESKVVASVSQNPLLEEIARLKGVIADMETQGKLETRSIHQRSERGQQSHERIEAIRTRSMLSLKSSKNQHSAEDNSEPNQQ